MKKMSPIALLSFCSPSGDTHHLPQRLWALVLEIHFPERGRAQCHPLLTYTPCEMETEDRAGLATQLGYPVGPILLPQGAGSMSASVESDPGRRRHLWMAASLLGGSGEENRNQRGFRFLNPNNEGRGGRQGQRKCYTASLVSN